MGIALAVPACANPEANVPAATGESVAARPTPVAAASRPVAAASSPVDAASSRPTPAATGSRDTPSPAATGTPQARTEATDALEWCLTECLLLCDVKPGKPDCVERWARPCEVDCRRSHPQR